MGARRCRWAHTFARCSSDTSRGSTTNAASPGRCADSLFWRAFFTIPATEAPPNRSSPTKIHKRLSEAIHEQVFASVLAIAHEKKLLRGQTVGADSTTPEANATTQAIVRKDTGEDYRAYLKRRATAAGIGPPTDENLRRFAREARAACGDPTRERGRRLRGRGISRGATWR
ncbi:hypothetical protein [Gemmata massiliana]|uniref:hypothetical protein n=1 Tax=Gemmata massiliana TaxID=1210884 RepID=UPI0013A6B124|nr:hypothetical protein [Gemmata massiliana]